MCAVFRLSSDQRVLTFAQIASIASLPEEKVNFIFLFYLKSKLIIF